MLISVQSQDFDLAEVCAKLRGERIDVGALVSFSGAVRDLSEDRSLIALELEHYPAMTQKSLQNIAEQAMRQWPIDDVAIIHRVGRLQPGDNIVLVVVVAAHRRAAFEACEFLMDYLKTRAPFWKKEITRHGEHWVEDRNSDHQAAKRWDNDC